MTTLKNKFPWKSIYRANICSIFGKKDPIKILASCYDLTMSLLDSECDKSGAVEEQRRYIKKELQQGKLALPTYAHEGVSVENLITLLVCTSELLQAAIKNTAVAHLQHGGVQIHSEDFKDMS